MAHLLMMENKSAKLYWNPSDRKYRSYAPDKARRKLVWMDAGKTDNTNRISPAYLQAIKSDLLSFVP